MNHRFGTGPVFFTAISTILGAILFLRFGYAVSQLGFLGVVALIILGHLVTIPTALAIAEIATNQRVEGGGEYFIISRSFGILVGAAIGVALYLSQAISVAFYVVAFGEAFDPVFAYIHETFGLSLTDKRLITLPSMGLLALLMVTKGADLGVKALYGVVTVLFVSLICFFLGGPISAPDATSHPLLATVAEPDSFFLVFAICFPAFTGVTAGVGLSGDLRNPRKSIPLGTLAAAICGFVVYGLIALKLAVSASPEDLASDQLMMSRIAVWGPIIPLGLACATLSSALGSILVAPRTLQALASDRVLPVARLNDWLAASKAGSSEPVNALLVTATIATCFVAIGDVDFVAQIISMFFMVTYGALCTIAFLEHFVADPAYRPVFHSRWYISLFGAAMCLILMFSMSALYAAISLVLMGLAYWAISTTNPDRRGVATIFLEASSQMNRRLQIFLQQAQRLETEAHWRPAVVCISEHSFERLAAFDLLRWIAHRYGFGTYIHYIEGYLSRTTHADARRTLGRLVKMADVSEGNVYVDTLVSPSYTSAISQLVQLPGVAGKENNMILFEYARDRPDELPRILEHSPLSAAANFDTCILASAERGFGYRREIHIWLTTLDYQNANLMILLAYVILGHPEWEGGQIKIFAIFPEAALEEQQERLLALIRSGRLPISRQNIEFLAPTPDTERKAIINEKSADADLVILGFHGALLKRSKTHAFDGYDQLGNVLFVCSTQAIAIASEEEQAEARREVEAEGEGAEEQAKNGPPQPEGESNRTTEIEGSA